MRKHLMKASMLGAAFAALLAASSPVFAATWVPGHYSPNGLWHPGYWVGGPGVWVAGYYAPNGVWYPGHWVGGYGPPPGPYEAAPPGPPPYGQHWVPGFYGPEGGWHPGYWAPN